MGRRKFDVGIVIPLREEFRYIVEVAPQLESVSHEGTYFYILDFGSTSAVCCLVGEMGPLPAIQATNRLLEFADVKLVIVLGLAGALHDDVAVGDVIIASEVNEFQSNSKAESTAQGYEVRYSGRHWPLDYRIREAISHFEFSSSGTFSSWQAAASEDYKKLTVPAKENVCSSPPSMHLGPIASGSVVAASRAFVSEVRNINRKFIAIDMEAAGVALAAAERIYPLPCLVVRGISDRADENKSAIDGEGKGSWRRYCVRSAALFLLKLLSWDGFRNAIRPWERAISYGTESQASELVTKLKSCVGGPWIVGAAYGIYPYGPRVIDGGNVIPMDLNQLRVLDHRISDLLDAAAKQQDALSASDKLDEAADGFAKLIEDFRKKIRSPNADLLLRDFDGVIMETLHPKDDEDDQVQALLMESSRLEEEVGAEAVIDLLKNREKVLIIAALRERYIDALAKAEKWSEIVQLLEKLDSNELSRSELQNSALACSKVGTFERAKEILTSHKTKYADNAGKLFRREICQRYPQFNE